MGRTSQRIEEAFKQAKYLLKVTGAPVAVWKVGRKIHFTLPGWPIGKGELLGVVEKKVA